MSYYQMIYFILGIIFISAAIFLFIIHYISSTFPSILSTTSLAVGVLCFTISYVLPKIKDSRENMMKIIYKALPLTVIFMFILSLFKWLMIERDIFNITVPQFLQLSLTVLILTGCVSFIIFEKSMYRNG